MIFGILIVIYDYEGSYFKRRIDIENEGVEKIWFFDDIFVVFN